MCSGVPGYELCQEGGNHAHSTFKLGKTTWHIHPFQGAPTPASAQCGVPITILHIQKCKIFSWSEMLQVILGDCTLCFIHGIGVY
jgi:hypothetical protein